MKRFTQAWIALILFIFSVMFFLIIPVRWFDTLPYGLPLAVSFVFFVAMIITALRLKAKRGFENEPMNHKQAFKFNKSQIWTIVILIFIWFLYTSLIRKSIRDFVFGSLLILLIYYAYFVVIGNLGKNVGLRVDRNQ